jgi:glycosyltransferase involved in cell wall biosynthesis
LPPEGAADRRLRLASFCVPHVGGTYVFTRNLRRALADEGIELRWIGVGPGGRDAFENPAFQSERTAGEVVGAEVTGARQQARELMLHLREREYDGVIIDVLAGELQANLARYLPPNILRIMVVHSITRGTYAYARAIRDHVHATVGVSERIQSDLVGRFRFPEQRCICVPHGLDPGFLQDQRTPPDGRELRILSVGRVDHQAKGILWLPEVLKRLADLDLRMTIAGEGPDLQKLKRRMSLLSLPCEFLGSVSRERLPDLYRDSDVMLMPSVYEGFGLTIIEAMASGCVPIVSRIRLVTDRLVDSGVNGWLFDVGNVGAAASAIRTLYVDRRRLAGMSHAARCRARAHSSLAQTGSKYARLIRSLLEAPPSIKTPLSLAEWELAPGIRPGVSTRLPTFMKPFLRKWRERLLYRR